jgi:hypothetical protein
MYTLIEYPVGVIVEAVVLLAELDRLRVAVAGLPDVLELLRSGDGWTTEDGQKIAVGFLQYNVSETAAFFTHETALAARGAFTAGN